MDRTFISNLMALVGQTVTVAGFVKTVRDQKRIQFVILQDPTGMVQIVNEKGSGSTREETISGLTVESAVIVTGLVKANPNVKMGGLEIVAYSLEVAGIAASPLPFNSDSALDLQMDWRALSIRRPENMLIFQVQTTLEKAMRDFWERNDFTEIHSPKLTGAATESGAELFQLEYFGQKASLAQSPQFYKQLAMAAGLNKVFEIGPVFRANPSFTSRHDTEFTSIDVEISWIESHEDVMALEEQLLEYSIARVAKVHGAEIKAMFGVEVVVPTIPFPRISMEEARKIASDRGHAVIATNDDLDPAAERIVAEYVKDLFHHEFVFVTDYPIEVRPFYHRRHADNPFLTKSFDLLWRGLEITTGAQREHRPEILMRQASEKGISLESIKHYIDFFRYGCPPHGGFGLGLTRLLMIILNRQNVREVTFVYRGPNRLTP